MRRSIVVATRTGVRLLALGVALSGTVATASAKSTVLRHADGSRTEIVSNKGVAQVKVFSKDGKLTSKTVDDSFPKDGGHGLAIKKYSKPGDTKTTKRGP